MRKIGEKNQSGARDPTACRALSKIQHDQESDDDRTFGLIRAVKLMLDAAGYDLLARVELRDRKTGRVYR